MESKNPFTLMYGIKSESLISRDDLSKIATPFTSGSNIYMYLIIGIRGCGKTVLLRKASETFSSYDDWKCVDINPQSDIISSLANRLSSSLKTHNLLDGWSISLNLPYIFITKNQKEKVNDPEIICEKILEKLAKDNKKVLVTIDEVNKTDDFRKFVNFYQSMIGKGLPLYLLMTGLKENINAIINDNAMTFLTRAPKIELGPLSLPSITLEYEKVFDIDKETALKMAKLTNGYAFAYQVLGYMFYEENEKKLSKDFIQKYETYLWSNGYDKFWNDLTKNERGLLVAISLSKDNSKEEILKTKIITESNYSQYRKRLLEKGLIISNSYGFLDFVLPRFKEYISYAKEF